MKERIQDENHCKVGLYRVGKLNPSLLILVKLGHAELPIKTLHPTLRQHPALLCPSNPQRQTFFRRRPQTVACVACMAVWVLHVSIPSPLASGMAGAETAAVTLSLAVR